MAGKKIVIVGEVYDPDLSVGGGPMPPGEGGPPPGIWPSPGHPAHPIAPGGPPPGIWPSPGHPAHPIAPGGPPPYPAHPIVIPPEFISDVHPEHPIVIPPPPEIWPSPGVPTHPIVIPPDIGIWPPDAKPEHPIVIPPPTTVWPPDAKPVHPIVIPPDGPPTVLDKWDVKAYWTEQGGWGVAIVPTENHPGVPTPS